MEKESGKQLSCSTHKEKLVNMLYRLVFLCLICRAIPMPVPLPLYRMNCVLFCTHSSGKSQSAKRLRKEMVLRWPRDLVAWVRFFRQSYKLEHRVHAIIHTYTYIYYFYFSFVFVFLLFRGYGVWQWHKT